MAAYVSADHQSVIRPMAQTTIDYDDIESTRSTDGMLEYYRRNRINTILGLIDSELFYPLTIDSDCLYGLADTILDPSRKVVEHDHSHHRTNDPVKRYYRCSSCLNMNRLTKLVKYQLGQPIIIQAGVRIGHRLMIEQHNLTKPFIKEMPQIGQRLKKMLAQSSELQVCEPSLVNLVQARFLASDPITNQVLVQWAVDYFLKKNGINTTNTWHHVFICGSNGYSLQDQPATVNPSTVDMDKHIVPLMQQLWASLDLLRGYDLSLGHFNKRTISLTSEASKLEYDGLKLESTISLKLSQLQDSSITLFSEKSKTIRLFASSDYDESKIAKTPFKPKVFLTTITPYDGDQSQKIPVYRLTDQEYDGQSLFYLRHMGIPLYQSSFNSYGLLIVLMTDSNYYPAIEANDKLMSLWYSLWLPIDRLTVQEQISNLRSKEVIDTIDIVNLLTGLTLRCDATQYIWSQIKGLTK